MSATKNTQYGGGNHSKWNKSWPDKDSSSYKSYHKSQQDSRSSSRGAAPWKRESTDKGKYWEKDQDSYKWGHGKKDKWSSR